LAALVKFATLATPTTNAALKINVFSIWIFSNLFSLAAERTRR